MQKKRTSIFDYLIAIKHLLTLFSITDNLMKIVSRGRQQSKITHTRFSAMETQTYPKMKPQKLALPHDQRFPLITSCIIKNLHGTEKKEEET